MVQALCYLLSCGCGTPAVGYNVKLRLAKIISPLFSRSTRGALRYYVTSVPVYVSIDAHTPHMASTLAHKLTLAGGFGAIPARST